VLLKRKPRNKEKQIRKKNAKPNKLCMIIKEMTMTTTVICHIMNQKATSKFRMVSLTVHCTRKLASSWLILMMYRQMMLQKLMRRVVPKSKWVVLVRKKRRVLPTSKMMAHLTTIPNKSKAYKLFKLQIQVVVSPTQMLNS